MQQAPMSEAIARRLRRASQKLGTVDPGQTIKPLLDRTFSLPAGDRKYAANALTPGAAPFEPSYSESQPNMLRFTVEPLGPEASKIDRRDEATREMRRLVRGMYGRDALYWFDNRSEAWRGLGSGADLTYGAFFGTSYDQDGLFASKVYYETLPSQLAALPLHLLSLVSKAVGLMPSLHPLFTTLSCQREHGSQRMTFLQRGPLRLAELAPLLQVLRLGQQLPGIMQIIGLALGGRFDLPDRSTLIGLGQTQEGPEFTLEVLLGMIPDVPGNFLDLLTLGMGERPRELQAMIRWLQAFTPEDRDWPGNFSVLSVRTTALSPPRLSLYLRPVEFEIREQLIGRRRMRMNGEQDWNRDRNWSRDSDDDRDGDSEPTGYGDANRERGEMPMAHDMEESKSTEDAKLLAFKIPEAPYSDETFKWIHKSIDLFEAVHTTMDIFEVELAGLLGLGIEVIAPLAAAVGSFFALGAGYAEGRAIVSRRRIQSGFALGVVTGADGREWSFVKRLFWEYTPEKNTFDEDAGRVAQKAFNTGLATGFLQGRQIAQDPKKKKFFWDSIVSTLSQGDWMEFSGSPESWPEQVWKNWYWKAEGSFIELYLKD
jgi:hypothetical protein